MVRHRIIVRHSGRWERAQYVDGVEEQIIMSSDGFCFRSLIREIHELLETNPTSVKYQLSWMSSTNSGRQIKTRLKDDADLLDLLHEQSSEMVVYVVQRGCSSSRVIPDTMPEDRDPVRDEQNVDDDAGPHEGEEEEEVDEEEEMPSTDEDEEENDISTLLESLYTEFCGWIRSTGGRGRLMGMMGGEASSNTRSEDVPERALSNWVVPLANLDIAGPLDWGEPSAAHTDTLYKGAIFPECPFRLCAVVDRVVWRIYKFNSTHTCHMDMSRIAPRQVPARVIAKHFARKLVDEGVVLKPKEMMSELLREYGIQIDYSFALRLRNIAIEMIYGDYDKSYVAFQEGSRPVVVIDGTHLKGRNKGILFAVVTKDGNEQILPIAIDLLIVSDQHQSIKNAVAAIFPRAAHGLCYYHLQNKMAKRGAHVIAMFKEAAYAYRIDVFQRHMSALELVSTLAYQKLCRIGPEHWSRSQCPARRFSFMTSNAAESLNARLLWARRLPICSMLEVFRRIVEEWFVERRATAQSWDHVLTPEAVNKLSKNVEHGRCFPVRCTTLAHLWKFEVGRESFMVDLQHRTCDCCEFELDLIPCSHAVAAIRFSGGHIYDFVDRCYKTETVVSMYDLVIMGLPSSEEWISPPYGSPIVLAPVIKKQVGRPRMSRARGGVEASSSS
ncbi:hypothetical protein C2S52_009145 [Perilla frutescens var. hirtella]|nr:hypothetical protein C2S52_009145 [Perilla frutescens var. hirtella]